MSHQTNDNLIDDIIDDPSKGKNQHYFEQGLLTEEERDRLQNKLVDDDRFGDFMAQALRNLIPPQL